MKPIRGRGSEGITVVCSQAELNATLERMVQSEVYRTGIYIERYLPGQELTVTVMPPGQYIIHAEKQQLTLFWCLPPVKRFDLINGIAPYNGTVAVRNNSEVLSLAERQDTKIEQLCRHCEQAAWLMGARAPIRIDCRADENGKFYLIDLNMKPNMTGSIRPHRQDQDGLTALAAKEMGWSFADLVENVAANKWSKVNSS